MSNHTPGPWKVHLKDRVKAGPFQYRGSIDGEGVELDEWEANAALIAAAPDLLAACKSIVGVFEGYDDVPLYVSKARAAVAKAEGKL